MKALASYSLDVDYAVMSKDTIHIMVPLETSTQTLGFAQGCADLLDKIDATEKQEEVIGLAVTRAEGFIVAAGGEVDVLVTNILNAVAAAFGKGSALYLFLVGNQMPWEIRALGLTDKIDKVKTWVGPLQGSSNAIVQGQGVALEKTIAVAQQRVGDLEKETLALKTFRELGPRKELVDAANALRATTYGALNNLVSTPAGAGLPSDLADRVFEYERNRRHRKVLTSKDLEKKIAAHEKEHAALLAQLEEKRREEEAAAETRKRAKVKPTEEALANARKRMAEMAAEVAALEAVLAGEK